MSQREIFITQQDNKRLMQLLEEAKENDYRADLRSLEEEVGRCRVVDGREIPPTVVTMNSKVCLRDEDTNELMEYTLVFPANANIDEGRISVLSPIGTAILGYSVGDTIEWTVPGGKRRIKIEKIPYQPEAAGHHHL